MTGTGIKVLIVDDEEEFRKRLQKMLAARGLQAFSVDGGQAALDELALRPFDVVLLDIRMPGMDGVQTLARIREMYPLVEVIMLSGHASVDSAMELIALGAYDYLCKPCPVDDIVLKIDCAFERKAARTKIAPREKPGP